MLSLDAEVINGNHIPMEKPGCRAGFLMESRSHVSLFYEIRPNDFNSDRPVERLVDTGIDCAHAPAADTPLQPVSFRKDSRHVHTGQSRSILSADTFSCVETRA